MTKSRDLANAATALNAVTAAELGFVDGVSNGDKNGGSGGAGSIDIEYWV